MPESIAGIPTFLLTDIEDSVALWEAEPDLMRSVMARHDVLVTQSIEQHGGNVIKARGEGDSVFTHFARATDALAAAASLQLALAAEPWPPAAALRLRIAVYTGEAFERDGDYYGPAVNRCARLREIAHGGQTLVSHTTYDVARDALPQGVSLRLIGTPRLRGVRTPEHVFQLLHPGLRSEFPPLRIPYGSPNNLPEYLTNFIGRQDELAALRTVLRQHRLTTLAGTAGVGKTRLAVQAAHEMLDVFSDGIWLVQLDSLTDPALSPKAIAEVIGIREEPNRLLWETVANYLRDKDVLLVLDNCEHLIETCAILSHALLQASPSLRILATSREPLNVAGEVTFSVPALSFPSHEQSADLESVQVSEAVRLFVDRASLRVPRFALTHRNVRPVAEICRRLDGIPLAIELAAARVNVLDVGQIAAHLDDSLSLLTKGSRMLARHQTLRAAIDWSYDRLTPTEQMLFRQLFVFAGGFTLGAVEAVCRVDGNSGKPAAMELLSLLVEKSLVVLDQYTHGRARYRMLETLRQYARQRSKEHGESDYLEERHALYFMSLAEEAEPELRGSGQASWLDRLEADHDNLRTALDWLEQHGHIELALRLAAALRRFWYLRGYLREGRQRVTRLLSLVDVSVSDVVRERALNAAGGLAYLQGDYTAARELYEESLSLRRANGDLSNIAIALSNLAAVARQQGDYATARSSWQESLKLFSELSDTQAVAMILNNLGLLTHDLGNYDEARALYEQSLERKRTLGDEEGMAQSLENLGDVARECGRYDEARRLLEESLAIRRSLGSEAAGATALLSLGMVERDLGHDEEAERIIGESLATLRQYENKYGVATALKELGVLYCQRGDCERAQELLEESLALKRELGHKPGIAFMLHYLGRVAIYQEREEDSRALLQESLAMSHQFGFKLPMAESLEGFVELALAQRQPERALRLAAAASALRIAIGAPLAPVAQPAFDDCVAQARGQLGRKAAAVWRSGSRMTIDDAVTYALSES